MTRDIGQIQKEINELVDEYMSSALDRNMANTGWVLCYKGVDLETNEFYSGYTSETSHDLTVALGLTASVTGRLTKRLAEN